MSERPSSLRRWFAFVVDHRALVLAVTIAISALAAWSTSRAVVASSVGGLFLGNSPAWQEHLRRATELGNDEIVAVGWRDPAPLSDASLDRIERAADALARLPEVGRVDALTTATRVARLDDGILVQTWADAARARPEGERGVFLDALRADPSWGGVLVGRGGDAVAVVVELVADADRPAEAMPALLAAIRGELVAAGVPRSEQFAVGMPVQIGAVIEETFLILGAIFPVVVGLLLGTVWLLFRRLWPAAISTSIAGLGVLWTMGVAVALDRHVNVLFAVVPAVVLIVAFSDVVHLCSAYRLELDAGRSKREAILASAEDVGRASFYTSATTFVGFVSLALIPTPVFRHLGLVLGFGVALSLLQAVTLTPLLFALLPEPPPLRAGAGHRAHDAIDAALDACRALATRRPRAVVAGSLALLVALAAASARITVETNFSERLNADHPVRQEQAAWFERFGGTNVLDLYVDLGAPDGLLDPLRFAALARLHDAVAALPGVDAVFSVAGVLRDVHGALQPDDPEPLPATRAAIAQHLLLFEGNGGDLARALDFERRLARVSVRVRGEGFRATADLGREAEALGARLLPAGVTVTASGLSFLLGDWLDEILRGQKWSLVSSILVIAAMMAMAVGSVRLGLASMPANLLPLLAYGGALGLMHDTVDSDALIVAVLALGVGVDDTIHFLVRYRVERARGRTREEAIGRTFDFAGRAIVMTTVILVVGFLPFAATGYFTTRLLGTWLPACLVVALLADLLLVPAMLVAGLGVEPEP